MTLHAFLTFNSINLKDHMNFAPIVCPAPKYNVFHKAGTQQ